MFIALGCSGVVPVLHGLSIYGWQGLEDRMSLSWVIANGLSNIFGAVLYAVSSALSHFIIKPLELTFISSGFRKECLQGHSISGAALTKSSTASW